MPTTSHETMHRIFQEDPGVFARAFHALRVPVPDPVGATLLSPDCTEIMTLERRLDTLLKFDTADGGAFLLAVEAQSQKDLDKPGAWAYYAAYLHEKYGLPPVLLVVCHDVSTARWAEGPFDIGFDSTSYQWHTLTVRPIVLGPHNVPVIDSVEAAARDIPLATLSAVTHARDADIGAILNVLAEALTTTDETTARVFAELTELGLGKTAAAKLWSKMMTIDTRFFRSATSELLRDEGRAEGRAEGRVEGRAEGRDEGHAQRLAQDMFILLDGRGLEVSGEIRDRITGCTDVDQLDVWFRRAVTAASMRDVFDAEESA